MIRRPSPYGPSFSSFLMIILIGLPGCSRGAPEAELLPLPRPDLEGFDSAVQEQVKGRWDNVEARLAEKASGAPLAAAYGELGRTYQAYALFESAEACYRNAEALTPQEATWPYLLGHVALARNLPEPAVEAFGRVLELDPAHVAARIHGSGALRALGRFEKARQMLQAALAQDPSSAFAHYRLGQLELEEDQPAAAIRHLKEALRLQPGASVIYSALAAAHQAQGDRAAALVALEKSGGEAVALADPLMAEVQALAVGPRAFLERGSRAFAARRFVEAEEQFRRAVAAVPQDAAARLNLGSALVRLGRLAEGKAEVEEALRLEPDNARAHFNLARIYRALGRDADGIDQLERSLELEPAFTSARLSLANALLETRHYSRSQEQFDQLVAEAPGSGGARLGQALSVALQGRHREASERLEKSVAALPEDPALTNALARILASSPDDAVRDGPRALDLIRGLIGAQSSLEHIETLAMALAETGDFATALEWQRRAIEAVRESPRQGLLAGLEANLARYERGLPCRQPWRPEAFDTGEGGPESY